MGISIQLHIETSPRLTKACTAAISRPIAAPISAAVTGRGVWFKAAMPRWS